MASETQTMLLAQLSFARAHCVKTIATDGAVTLSLAAARFNMKESMQDTQTRSRTRSAGRNPALRGYWSGFSVCLFILLLAVFTWAMHRRLTQYESIQQTGGHHMTAIKVCLTERPQVSVPAVHTMHGDAMFFVAVVFAFALFPMDDSKGQLGCRDQLRPRCYLRLHSCLNHFFFLPPPAFLLAS